MAEIRHDIRVDVTAVLPPGAASGPVEIAATHRHCMASGPSEGSFKSVAY